MSEPREAPQVVELKWEWPADRAPDVRIIVQVGALAEEGGLFGLKRSPSLTGSLPDPMILEGRVVGGEQDWVGKTVKLRLPKLELAEVKTGDRAELGLLAPGTCISVAKRSGN